MSQIVTAARDLMALMNSVTGTRATGVVTVTASGADVTLEQGTYAIPRFDNAYHSDMVIKVAEGPNEDKSWTVTSGGTAVNFVANIGGSRYNTIVAPAEIAFDPPVSGIASAVVSTDFTGGVNPTGLGAVPSMVVYEQWTDQPGDLIRSDLRDTPAVMVAWTDSEPADGASTSQINQQFLHNTSRNYRETFQIMVIAEPHQGDHPRRLEGMYVLDVITRLLTSQVAFEGNIISSPSGIQIRNRFRNDIRDPAGAVRWYVYGLTVSLMVPYEMTDSRTYVDLALMVLDEVKPDDDLGDIATVGDGLPGKPGVEIEP